MIEQLVEQQIERRASRRCRQLSDPAVIGDRHRYAEAGRAYAELEPAAKLAAEWRHAADDAAGARELLDEDDDDPELRGRMLGPRAERIERARGGDPPGDGRARPQRRQERDRRDPRRAPGGDEAGLFAGDLYRMLTKYAERRGFKVEPLSIGDGAYTFAIKGDGAYSVFKYEGGTHRVQRVPETESQGRIHTSTATVAVLPEAEDVDVEIDENDLQIDVYRSSGPGGQSVNTTDSAVRITHKPTGLVVSMQDEKSQLQNREKAMRVLRARLYEQALAEQQAELAADRRAQVGTGERAEKIRTYNYPQGRVTDHRIKLTVHNLEAVLEGELDEFTAALEDDEKRRRLEAARPPRPEPAGDVAARRPRARRAGRRPPARRRPACDAAAGRRAAAGGRARRGPRRGWSSTPRCAGARRAGAARRLIARRRRPRAGRLHPRPQGFRHLELAVDRAC